MPGLLDNFPAMTGLGIGLLQSAAARRGLGPGLGQGLLYAQQFGLDASRQQAYQQSAEREQQRFDWERQQAEAERRAEDEQRAAMTRFTANLPAETREMLNAGGMPALQAYVANQLKPKDPWMTAGATIFDVSSGKPVPVAQGAPTQRTNVSVLPPSVNIDTGSNDQRKAVQEFYGKSFSDMQKSDQTAPTRLARMEQLNRLLENVETGKWTPAATEFKAGLKGLGIDPEALGLTDNVGAAQAANALTREMALQLRSPEGGAGMPGAMSDQDRAFLESMIPGLAMTKEGRKLTLDFQRRMVKREQEAAKMARDYAQQNGFIDSTFFDQLAQFSAANPIAPPVMTPEQAAALPPGSVFVTTDGRIMQR